MITHLRRARLFRGAAMLCLLGMVIAGGLIPPAALALPIDPDPPGGEFPGGGGDGCLPQEVSPDAAQLNGVIYLVGPAMVGQTTRIRFSYPTLQLPDPRCDDGR